MCRICGGQFIFGGQFKGRLTPLTVNALPKVDVIENMVSIGKLNCDARIFRRPFAPVEKLWGAYSACSRIGVPACVRVIVRMNGNIHLCEQRVNSSYQLRLVAYLLSVYTLQDVHSEATAVRCGFVQRSIRGAASQRSKFGDRRQSFDLKSPVVRLQSPDAADLDWIAVLSLSILVLFSVP